MLVCLQVYANEEQTARHELTVQKYTYFQRFHNLQL